MRLDGLLFFPVTPFDGDGVDADVLATHIGDRLAHAPGAVFVACGTGEFHALSLDEHAGAVRVAVEVAAGTVPVVDCGRRAAELGADGLLVMPPYLVSAPVDGLVGYVFAVADAAGIPVIAYQRDNVRFTPAAVARLAAHPLVIGLKDGTGDLDLVQRTLLTVGRVDADFMFFNGLPTAELTMPAYVGIGIDRYSSAVFSFVPEVATTFYGALADGGAGSRLLRDRLLSDFYAPFVELRNRVPGYAVALVKAGVRIRGLEVGSVRLPLVDPAPDDLAELERLIAIGLEIAGG